MTKQQAEDGTIFLTLTGSHAYGLNTPESDIDIRGVCIPPKDYTLGLKRFEQFEGFPGEDKVLYDLRKALKLISDANPNMLDLLFAPEHCIKKTTKWWDLIKENRDLFLSSKIKHTFSGYAFAQLKRIKSHKAWLMNPVEEQPNRVDFGLPDGNCGVPKDQLNALLSIEDKFVNKDWKEIGRKEKAYKSQLTNWKQYQNWKTNRNPKRAVIEAKYGFDLKHASHLVRLLRMGLEILETGKVNVDRTNIDAEELRAIKNGGWTYEEIIAYCDDMDKKMDRVYKTTSLPRTPPTEKINKLCVDVIGDYYED